MLSHRRTPDDKGVGKKTMIAKYFKTMLAES